MAKIGLKNLKSKPWLWVFVIAMVLYVLWAVYLAYVPPSQESVLYPLLNGFPGNLIGEIFGGFLFLFLALHIDKETEEKIDKIVSLTDKSESLISNRERILENERAIERFEHFLKFESYHNIKFPDLQPDPESIGLEYTIIPVRDPKTGEPIKKSGEIWSSYIVQIHVPSYFKRLNSKKADKYNTSPIQENEYYFCRFFDGSWHMSIDEYGSERFKFYLSGKVGPVEEIVTANQYMNERIDFIQGREKIATLRLLEDGIELSDCGGFTPYNIYKDDKGNFFLQIWDSPLKAMYYTNPPGTYADKDWELFIEDIQGRAFGQKLANIKNVILKEIQKRGLELKKVPEREYV